MSNRPLRSILESALETVRQHYVAPPGPEYDYAQDAAQNAQGEYVDWWDAEAVAWDGRYALRREFAPDDSLNPAYIRLHNVLYRASTILYGEPRLDGSQDEAIAIHTYALDHLDKLLAAQEADGWRPPRDPFQEYQAQRQRLMDVTDVLTLDLVRSALQADTLRVVAAQYAGDVFADPLERVLAGLDAQALALIIRDMEDAENPRHELSEQVMLKIINACRAEGERRFGRDLFEAVISEYE